MLNYIYGQSIVIQPVLKSDSDLKLVEKYLPETVKSESELEPGLFKLKESLFQSGYFNASIDSFKLRKDSAFVYIYTGKQYEDIEVNWSQFYTDNDLPFIKEMRIDNKSKDLNAFRLQVKKILRKSEQNGYPFALVKLESVLTDNNTITADAKYEKGRYFEIDSIIFRSPVKLRTEVIEKYLNIKAGDEFDQRQIDQISNKLKRLDFIRNTRDPAVEFFPSGAKVYLFLKEKKNNQFDVLLGLLPNTNEVNRIKIVGQLNLELSNVLKYGEKFKLAYNGYSGNNKDFEIATDFLYLPKLPFGADAFFKLYLNDTTFLERNFGMGIAYPLFENSLFKINFRQNYSDILNVDEQQIISSKNLPEFIDFKETQIGLSYEWQNLNNSFNPSKGIFTVLALNYGYRITKKNSIISNLQDSDSPAFNFESLYDDLDLKVNNFNIKYRIENYFRTGSSSTLLLQLDGYYLSGDNNFNNQKIRIGGFNNLRGFDEQSILSDKYLISTLEYRYILQGNSFFSIFTDAAFLNNEIIEQSQNIDIYNSFGIGLNFETKNGIFGLQYAFGKMPDSNFDFRTGKVHFGFLNRF